MEILYIPLLSEHAPLLIYFSRFSAIYIYSSVYALCIILQIWENCMTYHVHWTCFMSKHQRMIQMGMIPGVDWHSAACCRSSLFSYPHPHWCPETNNRSIDAWYIYLETTISHVFKSNFWSLDHCSFASMFVILVPTDFLLFMVYWPDYVILFILQWIIPSEHTNTPGYQTEIRLFTRLQSKENWRSKDITYSMHGAEDSKLGFGRSNLKMQGSRGQNKPDDR